MDNPLPQPPQPIIGRRRVGWPVDMWPTADRVAWERALRPGRLTERAGVARKWRPASIKSTIGAYGRWLSYLASRGCLDMQSQPADRFTPDAIDDYVEHLQATCASVTVSSYIGVLSWMIQTLVPGRNWDWLREVQADLHQEAEPSRDKGARVVHAVDLLELGLKLMVAADAHPPNSPRAAAKAARDFRDGLMIALLVMRPLRQKNMLQTEIGQHLVPVNEGLLLRFTKDDMKDKKPFQVPFPQALEGALSRYLSQHRPILLQAPSGRHAAYPGQPAGRHLWVASGGTTFTPGALKKALERHTRPRFGHVVNTHLFRDCVATSIAYDDPEHVRICVQILGHSHFSTTEGYYIVAQSVAAGDHYHALIGTLRSKLTKGERERSRRRGSRLAGNLVDDPV